MNVRITACLLFSCLLCLSWSVQAADRKPNVLLICVDDLKPLQAPQRFERFDANKDGTLSRDEFVHMGTPPKP